MELDAYNTDMLLRCFWRVVYQKETETNVEHEFSHKLGHLNLPKQLMMSTTIY